MKGNSQEPVLTSAMQESQKAHFQPHESLPPLSDLPPERIKMLSTFRMNANLILAESMLPSIHADKALELLERYNFNYDKALGGLRKSILKDEKRVKHIEACEKAIKEKSTVYIRPVRFNCIGLPRSGKTTFLRRILGVILNIWLVIKKAGKYVQPSTGAAEDGGEIIIQLECSDIGAVSSSKWYALKGLSEEAAMISRLLYQAVYSLSLKPEKPLTASPTRNKSSSTSPQNVSSSASPSAVTKPAKGSSILSKLRKIFSSKHSASSSTDRKLDEVISASSSADETLDEVISIVDDALLAEDWDLVKFILEDFTLVSNTDIGGQAEFLDLQASLIQGPSFNLLFSRLVDQLDHQFDEYFTNDQGESTEKEVSVATVEEVLFQALSSIACFSGCFSEEASEDTDESQSKVMLIGTHRDMLDEEEFRRKDRLLQEKIKSTEFYNKRIIKYASEDQLMIAVDNMNGGEEEIERIRKIFEKVIQRSFKKVPIPASWLLLSLQLRSMNVHTMSLRECQDLASQLRISAEELQDALWFLHHRIGVLLYYPELEALKDTVICKMQVVFDSATNLIKNTFTFDKAGKTMSEKFREKAQFTLQDVKAAMSDQTSPLLSPEKLIQLLNHLGILTVVPPTELSDDLSLTPPTFFMPCVLRSAHPSELHPEASGVLVPSACTDQVSAPLMLRYDCGYVPIGVFPALITNLVSQQEHNWRLIEEGLRKNRVQFHVGDDYDIVTLMARPRFIEIAISRSEGYESSTEKLCKSVRKTVQSTIDSATSNMNYHFSMKYRFGFECPTHPGKDHLCVLERENAKRMECLQNPKKRQPVPLQRQHKVWFCETNSPASLSPAEGQCFSMYLSSLPASAVSYLDKELDWDHEGVNRHLDRIAEHMIDWETKLSTLLKMTEPEIHDLKVSHSNPILLRRAVLMCWKQKNGPDATYKKLLKLCCEGGDSRTATAICEVLKEKATECQCDSSVPATLLHSF